MGWWSGEILDWVNVAVVRARIGRRQPTPTMSELQSDPWREHGFQGPRAFDPAAPRRIDGDGRGWGPDGATELWHDEGTGWVASCHKATPARSSQSSISRSVASSSYRASVGGPERGGEGGRTALVLLHGWLATRSHMPYFRSLATPLRGQGCDIWMPRLPEHAERTPPGSLSGERCLSADIGATAQALQRAVAELLWLEAWLRRRGYSRVALWGMSLGGWVAALGASLSASWDAVALWAPVVEPAETVWSSPIATPICRALAEAGIDREQAASMFHHYRAARRPLAVPRDRVLVVGARYDNVVGRRGLARSAAGWGCGVWWVPHGHISLMISRATRQATGRFIADRLELN